MTTPSDGPVRKVRETTATPKQAGNRGKGRKKGVPNRATAAIKEIAGQYTVQAVETLVGIMAGGKGIPPAAQVAAAKELLDRAHGKPAQTLDANVTGDLTPEMKRWLGAA